MSKNSAPSFEFGPEDYCPSCGSPCNVITDLDDNDCCNDCRSVDSVEWLIQTLDIDTNDPFIMMAIKQAKQIRRNEMIKFAADFYMEHEWISSRTESSFEENVDRFARFHYKEKFKQENNGNTE